MSVVAEILSGYKNYFIGSDKVKEEEAKRRATICAKCPHAKRGLHSGLLPDIKIKEIWGLYCSICKCPLSPKVRSMISDCPKEKW